MSGATAARARVVGEPAEGAQVHERARRARPPARRPGTRARRPRRATTASTASSPPGAEARGRRARRTRGAGGHGLRIAEERERRGRGSPAQDAPPRDGARRAGLIASRRPSRRSAPPGADASRGAEGLLAPSAAGPRAPATRARRARRPAPRPGARAPPSRRCPRRRADRRRSRPRAGWPAPVALAHRLDLLREEPAVGRVGHRAERRDHAARSQRGQSWNLLLTACASSGRHRGREHEPGPLRARRVGEARRERREHLAPVGVPRRRAARAGRARRSPPPVRAAEALERRLRVVERGPGVADEVEVQAVHRVGAHDLADDAPRGASRHRRDATATGSSLRRRPRRGRPPRSARSRRAPRATSAAVATDFGTIAQSGCFSSTCPRGSGWPKCAASRTLTQAWTCSRRMRARASSRAQRVEVARLPLEQRAARGERRSGRTRRRARAPARRARSCPPRRRRPPPGRPPAARRARCARPRGRAARAGAGGRGRAGDRAEQGEGEQRPRERRPHHANGTRRA